MNQELEIVKNFILKDRQERYLNLLTNKNSRKKFLNSLAHFKDFDTKYIHIIEPSNQNKDFISNFLIKNATSDTCYLISEIEELDGKEMEIQEVVNRIVGYGMGTIISVLNARLIYYEGEDERFFLKK